MPYPARMQPHGATAPWQWRAPRGLAWWMLLHGLSAAAWGQGGLAEVQVTATPMAPGLGLRLPATAGSRTGIATRELPASLDQVDSETWQERGDVGMPDIVARTTGVTALSAPGNGGMSFSARGFTGVNSVGVAEDGLRSGAAVGTVTYPGDGWGYERVEVLRGPGSIAHGSGTAGATINAVRKQPEREPAHEVLAGAGSHGTARVGVGSAGPLGEVASYRLDVFGHTTQGERVLGHASGTKLMSTLRLQPGAALRLELLADISDQKPERYFGSLVHDGRVLDALRRQNYNVQDGVVRYRDKRLRARVQWQARDWLTVRNELYHFRADRHWKNIEGYRYQPASGTVERYDYLEILHDLDQRGNRLEVTIEHGPHRMVAGWEAIQSTLLHTNNSPYGGTSSVSVIDPVRGNWSSPDPTLPKWDTDTTQHAFYLEDAWQFQQRWLLLAGLRRDLSDLSRHERVSGTPFDQKLGGTAWRLGLTHSPLDATSLYGQLSQGHDPVANILSMNLANRDFKLTTVRQAEIGIKQQLAQGLGEWTAALYRIEKNHIITRDPDRPALSVQGGKQHSQGLELGAALRPQRSWRVEGNLALVDARFDALIEAGGERSGNRPANVPRQVANLWVHHHAGGWQTSLGTRHVGKRFADNANAAVTPAFTVFDAALAWQLSPGTTLRLTGRNLSDRVYSSAAISGTRVILGEGRRFDIAAHIRF